MLRRSDNQTSVVTQVFMVAVEVAESGPSIEQIKLKLADSLAWVEGCGTVDVDELGKLEEVNDEV